MSFVKQLPKAMKMYETHTAKEVAQKFGVTEQVVRQYACKLRKDGKAVPKKSLYKRATAQFENAGD